MVGNLSFKQFWLVNDMFVCTHNQTHRSLQSTCDMLRNVNESFHCMTASTVFICEGSTKGNVIVKSVERIMAGQMRGGLATMAFFTSSWSRTVPLIKAAAVSLSQTIQLLSCWHFSLNI